MFNSKTNKLIVIGWDGACFEIIDSLLREGNLPNLEKLITKGGRSVLNSTYPPISPVAWSSFLTGMNPGHHGIFGFSQRDSKTNDRTLATRKTIRSKSMWDFIKGPLKTGYFFVPMTYPVTSAGEIMISGLGTPYWNESAVHPPELFEEISNKFMGDNILEPSLNQHSRDKYIDQAVKNIKLQADLFMDYAGKSGLDFSVVVFGHSDRVQHFYWRQREEESDDSIDRVYKALDNSLGEIINHFPENTDYIIMSDHGAGPYRCMFLTNNWLYKEGYLAYNKSNVGLKQKILDNFPRTLKKVLKPFLPSEVIKKVKSGMKDPELGRIDWGKTRAYCDDYYGKIYINLEGDGPYGVVKKEEYDGLVKEISEKLYKAVDPTINERFIDKVYLKNDIYHGRSLDRAPDIVFTTNNFEVHPSLSHFYDKDQIFVKGGKWGKVSHEHSAVHRMEGIFICSGPSFQYLLDDEVMDITDLVPNILYLLGEKIPQYIDGKVKLNLFNEELTKERPVSYIDEKFSEEENNEADNYNSDEKKKIEDELKGLGYL